jgi:hypothetical protein
VPEQRRIGFRVGVKAEGGDEEEKFATLFDWPRVVPCEVSCRLRLGVVGEGEQVFSFELVLRCAMNKDIPA